MKQYYVEIVERGVNPSVNIMAKRMGPMSERKAERVRSGAMINLNLDNYYVRIVEENQTA